MKEMWKDIAGYEGYYQVSTSGTIRSVDRKVKHLKGERLLKSKIKAPVPDRHGYLTVELFKKAKGRRYLIHRLVAITFIENPENKYSVNHLNGKKTDNRLENLAWATTQENNQHALDTGIYECKGEANSQASLTEKEVIEIRKLYNRKTCNLKALAAMYNTTFSNVSAIIRRRTWKHI